MTEKMKEKITRQSTYLKEYSAGILLYSCAVLQFCQFDDGICPSEDAVVL